MTDWQLPSGAIPLGKGFSEREYFLDFQHHANVFLLRLCTTKLEDYTPEENAYQSYLDDHFEEFRKWWETGPAMTNVRYEENLRDPEWVKAFEEREAERVWCERMESDADFRARTNAERLKQLGSN